ncbi:hypothetical protein [Bradyrhizobium sp.]|uniref:hypothetical protein n=1 Tax=Bradyrhizobium sp. TaxID=376 RepID=UPI00345C09C5
MMKGGRNSEMLLQAADTIESLTRRTTSAEQSYQQQQQQAARNLELRQIAEAAADKLVAEAEALRVQLADEAMQAETERARLEERVRQLSAQSDDAEARLAKVTAELDGLRESLDSDTAVTVPIEALRLARTQFDYLAEGFAKSGDVISLTICEIGGCAIDQALAAEKAAANADGST